MSPADRWRAAGKLARVLIERLREGLTLTAREVEDAAADYLEAGLAEPAPVAGGSAEERARLRRLAEDGARVVGADPVLTALARAALPLLDALDAAEARAAQAELERDEARAEAQRWRARTERILLQAYPPDVLSAAIEEAKKEVPGG